MAADIRTLPDAELAADLAASLDDAGVCLTALFLPDFADDGGVVRRLIVNLAVARTIRAEQARRRREAARG